MKNEFDDLIRPLAHAPMSPVGAAVCSVWNIRSFARIPARSSGRRRGA